MAKSSTESTVRYALPADAPAIVAAYDWLFAPPGVSPQDWSQAVAVGRLEAAMADDRAAVLLADDADTIVGFATVYLDIVSVRFGQRAWVEDLAVAPITAPAGSAGPCSMLPRAGLVIMELRSSS